MGRGLQIHGLSFSYGATSVLCNVDLHVPLGEICAVIGASGAGKTSLLRCILRLEEISAGTISFPSIAGSFDVKRIGYVPQDSLLFSHMSVLRNVTLALTVAHGQSRLLASEAALAALNSVGMVNLAEAKPWQLSGGQRQRVAIARALAVAPAAYLIDEPTAALDPENSRLVGEILRQDVKARECCALVVTHNLAFARRNCDSIALLADGTIKWHLKTDQVEIEDALMELG